MKKCKQCGDYSLYDRPCKCQEYKIDSDGEESQIWAFSYEDAAEKYAIKYNEDDHTLMNETIEIEVCFEGDIKKFEVGAEPDIHYTVNEL